MRLECGGVSVLGTRLRLERGGVPGWGCGSRLGWAGGSWEVTKAISWVVREITSWVGRWFLGGKGEYVLCVEGVPGCGWRLRLGWEVVPEWGVSVHLWWEECSWVGRWLRGERGYILC